MNQEKDFSDSFKPSPRKKNKLCNSDDEENNEERKMLNGYDLKQSQTGNSLQRKSSFDEKIRETNLILKKEMSQKIDKEYMQSVKQNEICLFCNLYDLFTNYEYIEKDVLQPKKVRISLEQIFFDQSGDFEKGKMGCAQETMQDILNYLHREYCFPNYLEEYLLMDSDDKFKIDNQLDDRGCSPKCPAHQTFGLDFCEVTNCKECGNVEDVTQVKRELVHQLYVDELM